MELSLTEALNFQNQILPRVSRSFALTIPQLPNALRVPISNCYLWCRISDTVEDDDQLNLQEKFYFHQQLILAITGKLNVTKFAKQLLNKLSTQVSTYEKALLENIELIRTVTDSLPKKQAKIVIKCVTVMNHLMPKFEPKIGIHGLKSFTEFTKYCYAVAGIVGESLTELFTEYLNISEKKKYKLLKLAISFGQALQTTNILKDRWEDYKRNICWLPRNFFETMNFVNLLKNPKDPIFINGIKKLITINYEKLKQSLDYVLMIPAQEIGLRKFCLWAIGMAVATLNNINHNPSFTELTQIKISRFKLRLIILVTNSIVKYNWLLKLWFKWNSRNLNNKNYSKLK